MANVNLQLEAFRAFANSDVAADQAAQMKDGGVTSADKTASWLARKVGAGDVKAENNRVRNALVAALVAQFGVASFDNLPDAVKAALKGTHAITAAGDFGFNDDGKAASGRPLTKRRIAAVIRAVEHELGAGDGIPRSCAHITRAQLTSRTVHADEIVNFLMDRFTADVNGEKLVYPRYEAAARGALESFVKNQLVHMGDGGEKHSFADLADVLGRRVCFGWELSMNWLARNKRVDENGTLTGGEAFRLQYVAKALEDAILAYNALQTESAYFDYRAPTEEAVRLAQERTNTRSVPLTALTPENKTFFVDVLCKKRGDAFVSPKSTDDSFGMPEKDLNRGQRTTVGDQTFGKTVDAPWTVETQQAYRAKVREMFRNDEGMIRLFNGIATQGFSAAVSSAVLHQLQTDDMNLTFAVDAPFTKSMNQKSLYNLQAEEDGSYTLTYAFSRTGDAANGDNAEIHAVDMDASYNRHTGRIHFAKAEAATPGAREIEYTGDDGELHTLWFTMEVEEITLETKLAFFPDEN